MKIRLKNVLVISTLLFYWGAPVAVTAQMTQADLLAFLQSPSSPISEKWSALPYRAAAQLGFAIIEDSTDSPANAVLPLLTAKALQSVLSNQQDYLDRLLSQVLANHPELNYSIWEAAKQFPKEAFGSPAQKAIQDHLQTKPQYLDKWLLLAGFATDNARPIRQLLAQRPTKRIQLAGKLALVRMGEQQYAKNFLRNIKRIPIDDDFIYDLAPLAIYTRDPNVLAYLVDIIMKDQGQCHPADAETAGDIPCAYRLVELLGPILTDFPIHLVEGKAGSITYHEQQMKGVKKWLKSHKKKLPIDRQHW